MVAFFELSYSDGSELCLPESLSVAIGLGGGLLVLAGKAPMEVVGKTSYTEVLVWAG